MWPGEKSLSSFIQKNRQLVNRKNILDFGCGSGVVSIAAALSGAAKVVANDIDPLALYIAQKNFKVNNVLIEIEPKDLSDLAEYGSFDLIFAVDMFYELSTSGKLLNFLSDSIRRGTEVIISDGGRPFAPKEFIQQIHEEVLQVDKELEGVSQRKVRILKLSASD